ncbi:MAG: vitamin B12-dependent ribonucleotide reductase, partial [Gluconacetobacter diazotrophicus]|nr:vitamin B12-dependent ribonucleotide reductase [Gluconacetobacter diazotrophicus]
MTARSRSRWHGVRMRRTVEAADPDCAPRAITLPADWDDAAASALAAIVPGEDAIVFGVEADGWIDRVAAGDADTARALGRLLLAGRAAPLAQTWHGEPLHGVVLRLSGFTRPGSGFETEDYAEALSLLASLLRARTPADATPRLLLTDLDGCLAGLGLDYDSEPARDVARCLAAAAAAHCDEVA